MTDTKKAAVAERIERICSDIQEYLKDSNQKYLARNIHQVDILPEEMDVLCKYFSVPLVVAIFGGNYQVELKGFNRRMKQKAIDSKQPDVPLVEFEPPGIGGVFFIERMRLKIIRDLEKTINAGINTSGQGQVVQAAKALLPELKALKEDAITVMEAYQTQLLVLAEHLVENFLPLVGDQFKKDFQDGRDDVIKKVSEVLPPDGKAIKVWSEEIDRFIRMFGRKRFELLLAESLIKNEEVAVSFDFTRDILTTYRQSSEVVRDSKSSKILKKHIRQRSTG